jgi:hypothetical protein
MNLEDKHSNSIIKRREYYRENPNDPDAKKDKDFKIRHRYYSKHPLDKDASLDEDELIRYNYFYNSLDFKEEENFKEDILKMEILSKIK